MRLLLSIQLFRVHEVVYIERVHVVCITPPPLRAAPDGLLRGVSDSLDCIYFLQYLCMSSDSEKWVGLSLRALWLLSSF